MGLDQGCFVTYLRVSTDRQGRSDLDLKAQHATVAAHADAASRRVVAEYVQIESGRKQDHRKFAAALGACRTMCRSARAAF